MAIKMVTPQQAVNEFFKKAFEIIKDEVFNVLAKLGEECVGRIRDRSGEESWFDHTHNLRASIGYSIYDYGVKQVESAFNIVGGGVQGQKEGRKMVAELASEYSNCFALVVVAAMNYADKVEALENKDVLESTKIWATSVVNQRLANAKETAIKKINALRI